MLNFWKNLEGSQIGRYLAGELIIANERGARFHATSDSGDAEPGVLHVVAADSPKGEEVYQCWTAARPLQHPHLARLLDVGLTEAAGMPLVYSVTERSDEVLSAALQNRALTPPEVRKVLAAAASALKYLHGAGFAHGNVTPSHILAIGEEIKLSVETVRPAAHSHSKSHDIQALGLTVYECLTARRDPELALLDEIPADLAGIIRACRRATAVDPSVLDGIEESLRAAPAPESMDEPELTPLELFKRVPRLVWAGLAAVLLIGFTVRLPGTRPEAAARPSDASRIEMPLPKPVDEPEAAIAPDPAKIWRGPKSEQRKWRVVVYTYSHRDRAEAMVERIRKKWPEAKAEIYSPSSGTYYVSIGGRMTRAEAVELQRKAKARGLPRDTFVRNFAG